MALLSETNKADRTLHCESVRTYSERNGFREVHEVVGDIALCCLTSFTWLDYFIKLTGYTTLESALLYTMIAPLLTFAGFKIYQIKSLKFWQWYYGQSSEQPLLAFSYMPQ